MTDLSALPCSEQAFAIGEPLPGTAPMATGWVVVEHPGSWGGRALRDADLPDGLGELIAQAASANGIGVLLARHPDRTIRDLDRSGSRTRVWVADVRTQYLSMRSGLVHDVRELADWDFAAIAAGQLPTVDEIEPAALLLVCTQGGRDACCARIGRPVLVDLLAGLEPPQRDLVWEASHIGGHRFAPTLLALPTGAVYGRLDAAAAELVLQATTSLELKDVGLRGRTCLAPAAQVAEIAVRQHINDWRVPSLTLTSQDASDGEVSVGVRHQDGREWTVLVIEEPLARRRAESCGAEVRLGSAWRVSSVSSVT